MLFCHGLRTSLLPPAASRLAKARPMPFVIYTTVFFSENAVRNITALLDLPGVRLGVISQVPQEGLLIAHWRIDDALDAAQLLGAARALAAPQGLIARLFSATEQLQEQLAEARTMLGIAGLSVEALRNFRDKARIKAILRAAGLPCARYCLVADPAVWTFAAEVGYPLVVKPPAGAAMATIAPMLRPAAKGAGHIIAPPLSLPRFICG